MREESRDEPEGVLVGSPPPVTARTVQGMARAGPGRLRPGPWFLTGVFAEAALPTAKPQALRAAVTRVVFWLMLRHGSA